MASPQAPASDTPPGPPTLEIAGGCATIRLNRPAHHNRLHVEDLLALQRHVDTLRGMPELHALVIRASGPSFCSGFHLGGFDEAGAAASAGPHLFEQTVDALEALPVATVCRMQGSVYGGATDLALACDFRIGVDTMKLRMPAVRLGLHYYPSGLRRYVTRLGPSAAKRLFLLAEEVGADELLRLGYLDRLARPDRLDAEVDQVVDALQAGAPLALRGMKQSLDEIARGEYHLSALREREARCAASDDLREGKAAIAEKRTPRFTGR